MSKHYVVKLELCEHPLEQVNLDFNPARCNLCSKRTDETGYIQKLVDADEWLLEALKRLIWHERVSGRDDTVQIVSFNNPKLNKSDA